MYSIKNREDLEKLDELISLKNQVKELRLQDKLGKQNFHENLKNVFEPVTDTNRNVSEDLTKTMMLTSKEANKAQENLIKNKLLDIMKDRGIMAPSSKITNPEHTSQNN